MTPWTPASSSTKGGCSVHEACSPNYPGGTDQHLLPVGGTFPKCLLHQTLRRAMIRRTLRGECGRGRRESQGRNKMRSHHLEGKKQRECPPRMPTQDTSRTNPVEPFSQMGRDLRFESPAVGNWRLRDGHP